MNVLSRRILVRIAWAVLIVLSWIAVYSLLRCVA
jgi:hypothetical protein